MLIAAENEIDSKGLENGGIDGGTNRGNKKAADLHQQSTTAFFNGTTPFDNSLQPPKNIKKINGFKNT